MSYQIDYDSWFKEGGYCQLYPIKHHPSLAFKEFRSKKHAKYAYQVQKKLSKLTLAPNVYTEICKLNFHKNNIDWVPDHSDWGYVTEIAKVVRYTENIKTLKRIQLLVDQIYEKTRLKFWDCHFSNIGLIDRSGKHLMVCIDTGKESFDGYANAWGLSGPGPRCEYCNTYKCECEEE